MKWVDPPIIMGVAALDGQWLHVWGEIMLQVIQLIIENCNRHHRRYIFNKKNTRKFREHYYLTKANETIKYIQGDDSASDENFALLPW